MKSLYANEMVPGDIFHPAEIVKDEKEIQNRFGT